MERMWVTGPEERDPERLRSVEAEGARVQAEVEAIEHSAAEGTCRICGSTENLTDEHTPSQRAGNIGRLVRGMIDYAASVRAGEVAWKAELLQGGAKRRDLVRELQQLDGPLVQPRVHPSGEPV